MVEYIGQDLINAIEAFMKKNKVYRISDDELCKILEELPVSL